MRKLITCLVIVFFSQLQLHAQTNFSLSQLKSEVLATLSQQKGVFAVAFKDLKTGDTLLINEHQLFHAASTMKTPVLVEVYKQVAEKKFSLSDSIILKNEFMSIADGSSFKLDSADDSEKELYKHIGEKRTVSDLVYNMITVSSNFSTNLIIEKVGAENVTKTMRSLGLKDLEVLRGVEDNKAYQKGLNNVVTAFDLMQLFEKIARGQAGNAHASEEMIRILEDQKFNEIIPAELPAGVKVAHKTGSFKTVHHDSGIVILPNGRKYVLVILSRELVDEEAATKAMAHVSGLIYKFISR